MIRKNFFLKVVIPAIAVLMLAHTLFGISGNPKRQTLETLHPVATSVYERNVAGVGITEPKNEEIEVGTNMSGIVAKVYVKAGEEVKKGDELFTIDDRQLKGTLTLREAEYEAAKLDAAEKRAEFEMYRSISDRRAYSQDEYNKKRAASDIADQKVKQADARANIAAIELEKATVKSPINGEILNVDISQGEFASTGSLDTPLMVVGDLSVMHVRVEIDESEAHLVSADKPAIAYLRGNPNLEIPLEFVRIEPKIVPKLSISGANAAKIDSRVLQVIYSFENIYETKVLVGQQMDVYIGSDDQEEEEVSYRRDIQPFPLKKVKNGGVSDKIVNAQFAIEDLFHDMRSKVIKKN